MSARIFPENLNSELKVLVTRLENLLAKRAFPAYYVGGFVRDLLLGRTVSDIDIAVGTDVNELAVELAAALGVKTVTLDAENGINRLLPAAGSGEKWQIDLSRIDSSLENDLGRRDFTLNAMAVPLGQMADALAGGSALIDLFGGRDDIARRTIRAVSATIFQDDGARLLRAVRLAAELGYTVADSTVAAMESDHAWLAGVAGERVREELLRLLKLPGTENYLRMMEKIGLLGILFPELSASVGVTQPREHAWDVFEHSLKSISAFDFILGRGDWPYAGGNVLDAVPWNAEITAYFGATVSYGSDRRQIIKMAALLHDVAKPQTRHITDTGRIRFFGHPQLGGPLTAAILGRLRFSQREIDLAATVVREHLRPVQMGDEDQPTPRALYRYYRDLGEAAWGTAYFSLADHLAARGPNLDLTNWRWHVNMVACIISAADSRQAAEKPAKLVDGNTLQTELGLAPGPALGRWLEAVHEAQAAGEVNTRREALDYIKMLIGQGKNENKI